MKNYTTRNIREFIEKGKEDDRSKRIIGKVIKVLSNRVFLDNLGYAVLIKDIVKHSKQLIDLIEVGDIVEDEYNKYEVAFVKDDKIYCNDYNLDDSLITLREQDIKAILTKEIYMANCYKVGGEE